VFVLPGGGQVLLGQPGAGGEGRFRQTCRPLLFRSSAGQGIAPVRSVALRNTLNLDAKVPASDHSRITICVMVRQLPGRPARRSTCRARARSEVGCCPARFRGRVARVAAVAGRYQNVI